MKHVLFLMLLVLVNASTSLANQPVYECNTNLDMGDGTTIALGISVEQSANGNTFQSKLVGTADDTQIIPTEKNSAPISQVNQFTGVSSIINELNLSSQQLASVKTVNIYTVGSFDEDASGVKAIELLDANSNVLAKGMFFGWAGIHKCK